MNMKEHNNAYWYLVDNDKRFPKWPLEINFIIDYDKQVINYSFKILEISDNDKLNERK